MAQKIVLTVLYWVCNLFICIYAIASTHLPYQVCVSISGYTLLSYGGGFVNDNGWALVTSVLLVRVDPFLLSDDVAAAACLICSKVALHWKPLQKYS